MTFAFVSTDEGRTKSIAEKLAGFLRPGDVVSLTGDLGAGKTTFVQGLAAGLGCDRAPTSPTFTIMHQYNCTVPLYHFDAYRLSGPADLERLGYEDYFYGEGITVIEWGDIVSSLLPPEVLTIEIDYVPSDDNSRLITLESTAGHLVDDLAAYRGLIGSEDAGEENGEGS